MDRISEVPETAADLHCEAGLVVEKTLKVDGLYWPAGMAVDNSQKMALDSLKVPSFIK